MCVCVCKCNGTETTQHSRLTHQSKGDNNYQHRTKNKTWPEIAVELYMMWLNNSEILWSWSHEEQNQFPAGEDEVYTKNNPSIANE